MDKLTPAEALAVRWQSYFEYLADILDGRDISAQMEVFRKRGG